LSLPSLPHLVKNRIFATQYKSKKMSKKIKQGNQPLEGKYFKELGNDSKH
jgi:hypothetical protein